MVHYKNEQVKATRDSLDETKKTLYYTDCNTIITFFKIMWHLTIINPSSFNTGTTTRGNHH